MPDSTTQDPDRLSFKRMCGWSLHQAKALLCKCAYGIVFCILPFTPIIFRRTYGRKMVPLDARQVVTRGDSLWIILRSRWCRQGESHAWTHEEFSERALTHIMKVWEKSWKTGPPLTVFAISSMQLDDVQSNHVAYAFAKTALASGIVTSLVAFVFHSLGTNGLREAHHSENAWDHRGPWNGDSKTLWYSISAPCGFALQTGALCVALIGTLVFTYNPEITGRTSVKWVIFVISTVQVIATFISGAVCIYWYLRALKRCAERVSAV